MSSSNYRRNKAFIDKYRKELKSMLDDISDIDKKVLNKAVNEGVKVAKDDTNVISGFMRKSWGTTPTTKTSKGVEKSIINTAEYSSYVNYGHRLVNLKGETVGFVKGQFILERAMNKVNKQLIKEFEKEVEMVNKKHDK